MEGADSSDAFCLFALQVLDPGLSPDERRVLPSCFSLLADEPSNGLSDKDLMLLCREWMTKNSKEPGDFGLSDTEEERRYWV